MIKLIKTIILLTVLPAVSFFVLSVSRGGEPIRWLGTTINAGAQELGITADTIHDATEQMKAAFAQTADTVKKTGEMVRAAASRVKGLVEGLTGGDGKEQAPAKEAEEDKADGKAASESDGGRIARSAAGPDD